MKIDNLSKEQLNKLEEIYLAEDKVLSKCRLQAIHNVMDSFNIDFHSAITVYLSYEKAKLNED